MPITVYDETTAAWQTTDDLWVFRGGAWVMVIGAYVWTAKADGTPRWVKLFSHVQEPPFLSATVDPNKHDSVTLTWTAAPEATAYQLRMTLQDGSLQTYPTGDGWTTALSHTWTGLKIDQVYKFAVRAKRPSPGGPDLISADSNIVTLHTGHPEKVTQNAAYPGTQTFTCGPNKTDTWDSNTQWNSWPGNVVQGYETQKAKRARGCARYQNMHGALSTAIGNGPADNVEVTSALIDRIFRQQGGAGSPRVEVFAAAILFSSSAKPVSVGAGSQFQAPQEGTGKVDFAPQDTALWLGWVQKWARGDYTKHNGLMIYRGDDESAGAVHGYGGYCVFRGKTTEAPQDWRIRMQIRWSYVSTPYQPPTLS